MKKTATSHGHFFSDMRYLLTSARRQARHVRTYMLSAAVIATVLEAVQLFLLPILLRLVETAAPMPMLLAVIAMFTAGIAVLRFAEHLVQAAFAESRDRYRTVGSTALVRKALTVSYPKALAPESTRALKRAAAAMGKHIEAPVPHSFLTISACLTHAAGLLLYAVLLLQLSGWLMLVTLVTAAVCAWLHEFVQRRGNTADREAEKEKPLSYVSQVAGAHAFSKDIRVFGLAPWLKSIHDSGMRALNALIERRAKIYFLYNIADAVLMVLRNGVAYMVLIGMVESGQLPLSAFLLYFAAIGGFTQCVSGCLSDVSTLAPEMAQFRDYRRYMEQEDDFCCDGEKPLVGTPHTIELKNVSFTYPGASAPTLSHIDLVLHSGEKLAIVGRDGHGKSTLARLLCGLYDPDEGQVLLDGKDVRTLDRRAYYALFSTVFEESTLLDMTIAETLGGKDEARLWECLEKVGLARTVRAWPRGLDTPLGQTVFEDGVTSSGGQTQRLLLARALYKNGDVLILDEPTAALDPLAENELYREYDRMTAGKSAVFISRRLASTRFCDRILYLKDAVIAEEGTHDELMALAGDYARLYELQSRYYREGRDPEDDIG